MIDDSFYIKIAPSPVVIGALCSDEREIDRRIARAMNRLKPRIAFLPFVVEKRYLKNTVACMRLMDVAGLFICGNLRADIARHLTTLDSLARRSRSVDAVVRYRGKFVGIDLVAAACVRWLKCLPKGARGRMTAWITGAGTLMPSIAAAIAAGGPKIAKARGRRGAKGILISMTGSGMRKYSLSREALMGLFCQTCVRLLTRLPNGRNTLKNI